MPRTLYLEDTSTLRGRWDRWHFEPPQELNHYKHLPTGSVVGSAIFHTDRRTWQQASKHKPDSSSPFIYLILCPPPSPPYFRVLLDWIKSTSNSKVLFSSITELLHLKRYAQKEKKYKKKNKHVSVWLEIWDSTESPDILFYVSNQQQNVNVSLAPARAMGAESVCVCLTPKCLKCPLSARLSLWPQCWCMCRRHNNQLTEPICGRLLPLSPKPIR